VSAFQKKSSGVEVLNLPSILEVANYLSTTCVFFIRKQVYEKS